MLKSRDNQAFSASAVEQHMAKAITHLAEHPVIETRATVRTNEWRRALRRKVRSF